MRDTQPAKGKEGKRGKKREKESERERKCAFIISDEGQRGI